MLSKQNRNIKSIHVDHALNILYFASGIFYHRIKDISSVALETDRRLTGVEDVAVLLRICKWTGATAAKELDSEIIEKMNIAVNQLGESGTKTVGNQ